MHRLKIQKMAATPISAIYMTGIARSGIAVVRRNPATPQQPSDRELTKLLKQQIVSLIFIAGRLLEDQAPAETRGRATFACEQNPTYTGMK